MATTNSLIRLGVLMNYTSEAPFMIEMARRLHRTGEVRPVLIQCRDKAAYPECEFPLIQLRDQVGEDESVPEPEHAYDLAEICGYEQFLAGLDVDTYFAERFETAALTLAAQAEALFARGELDCLLAWGGTRLNIRAVTAAARACGVPVVTMETPYFQELPEPPEQAGDIVLTHMKNKTLIWDTVQAPQCGPSQLSRDWSKAEIHPGLPVFLEGLKSRRLSKFGQQDIQANLTQRSDASMTPEMLAEARRAADPAAVFFKPPQCRALLVLGQTDHDSSMFYNRHLVRSWRDLGLELARRLPSGWLLWFKGHPLETSYLAGVADFAAELLEVNPYCRVLPTTMDVHLCYQAADAVACINSTATIEAALYELPVVNLGQGSFTHIGMTWPAAHLDDLGPMISELPERMTREQIEIRDRFLSYVLYDYLLPVGSPRRAVARLREAMAEARNTSR